MKKANGMIINVISIIEKYFSSLEAGSSTHADPLAFSVMKPYALEGNCMTNTIAAMVKTETLVAI